MYQSASNHRAIHSLELAKTNQVRVVSMRLRDCLDDERRRHNLANAGSLLIHAIRLVNPAGVRSSKDSRICSSSDMVMTHAVNITTTCSSIMSAVRDRVPILVPSRKACNCVRQALMSETSCRTPSASFGASFVPRMKLVKIVLTVAVAPSRPTTAAATERGSIRSESVRMSPLSSYLLAGDPYHPSA